MNIYFFAPQSEGSTQEIFQGLKKLVQDQYPEFEEGPIVYPGGERPDQFFLKGKNGILWNRIFYTPPSRNEARELYEELARLSETFNQNFFPTVFFPSVEKEVAPDLLEGFGTSPRFFEYAILQSEGEKGMALKPWPSSESPGEKKEAVFSRRHSKFSENRFGAIPQGMRLGREELEALIDLGMALKTKNPSG